MKWHSSVASTRKWNDIHDIALEKQTSRGILIRRCCENMKQTYRTPMSKWDYNKAALNLYWNNTSAWVLSCKLTAYFQNTCLKEQLWRVAFVTKKFHKTLTFKTCNIQNIVNFSFLCIYDGSDRFQDAVVQEFCKKGAFKNFTKFTGKHSCQSLFLNKVKASNEETLAQVFSCEFFKISRNTFFTEHLCATASGWQRQVYSVYPSYPITRVDDTWISPTFDQATVKD